MKYQSHMHEKGSLSTHFYCKYWILCVSSILKMTITSWNGIQCALDKWHYAIIQFSYLISKLFFEFLVILRSHIILSLFYVKLWEWQIDNRVARALTLSWMPKIIFVGQAIKSLLCIGLYIELVWKQIFVYRLS